MKRLKCFFLPEQKGEARQAFGGTIPLIGIASWGNIEGTENLALPNDLIEYGDLTRKPVKYKIGKLAKKSVLDPNHSHFVFVDDGTVSESGKEISFRSRLEECACQGDRSEEQLKIAEELQDLRMGWEGCRQVSTDEAPSSGIADEEGAERSHSVSICVGGGLGLIDAIVSAVRIHTPVLVLKGSGALADLIAACVRIHGSDTADDSEEEEDDVELAPFDEKALKVALCVKKIMLFMAEIKELALMRKTGLNYDWPPKLPVCFDDELTAQGPSWRDWKRMDGKWTHGRYVDGIWVADRNWQPLDPGSAGHLDCISQMGLQLVLEYGLSSGARSLSRSRLLQFTFDLYEAVSSGLCMIHDLDATLASEDPYHQSSRRDDVQALLMQCITRRFQWDAYAATMSSFLEWWRKYSRQSTAAKRVLRLHPQFEQGQALLRQIYDALDELPDLLRESESLTAKTWGKRAAELRARKPAEHVRPPERGQSNRILQKVQIQMEVERRVEFNQLKLNIEWGNPAMVRAKLDELVRAQASLTRTRTIMNATAATPLLDHNVLNKCLHLAMVHDSCDIAALLFSRGADTTLYDTGTRGHHDLSGCWRELVVSACGHADNEYLLKLVQQGWSQDTGKTNNHSFSYKFDKWISTLNLSQLVSESSKSDGALKVGTAATPVGKFDPTSLEDDAHALSVLFNILGILIPSSETNHEEMDFTLSGIEMQLSLCLLLTNRRKLSMLLWIRDFDLNASSLLQNALIASLVCRKLEVLPIVARHHHLKETFRQTAKEYELCASRILQLADEKDSESTLKALEMPMAQCSAWSTVDLIFKANCRTMVKDCLSICEDAVQRRFMGLSGLSSAASRWRRMLTENSQEKGAKFIPTLHFMENWTKLTFCITMDLISFLHYFFLFLPDSIFFFILVPLMAWILHHIFRNSLITVGALFKWLFPWFPHSIIGWLLEQYESAEEGSAEVDDDILPIDLFVLDLLAHIMHAVALTTIILADNTWLSVILEIVVLFLLMADIFAEIVLAGIEDDTIFLTKALTKGLVHFLSEAWFVIMSELAEQQHIAITLHSSLFHFISKLSIFMLLSLNFVQE